MKNFGLILFFVVFTSAAFGHQCRNEKTISFFYDNSFQTKYFTTSDGIKLRYLSSGQGPTLIIQPGWMMPADIFKFQLDHLLNSFRIIVLDPRGQGLSEDSPDNNYVERRARDIDELIEFEKIDSFILAGWSLGVPEVLYYVDKFGTKKLKGLVLIDGPITTEPKEVQQGWKSLVHSLQTNRAEFEKHFISALFKKEQHSIFVKTIKQRLTKTPTNSSFVALATHVVEPKDYSSILAKVDVPVLITLATWTFQLENYKQFKGNVSIETFQCGHALFVDEAERFNRLIIEMFSKKH
ncbi:MAG: alpha/beta hydrolase [Flavobacterium sp.]|nr:MAG: alpha/beta hydrolase [Flavobacterium sp.]